MNYPYSLKFSIGTIVLMIILMLMLLSNVWGSTSALVWGLYGFFTIVFLSLVALLVVKRLLPAIKDDIALALDEEGINDYIRNVSIKWDDIKQIDLIRGRSASTLLVILKWESDYGSQIAIPLRWVKGKDDGIYQNVLAWFTQQRKDINTRLPE